MKDHLIDCYHDLLRLERRKLREDGDNFTTASRLDKKEIENICEKFNLTLNDLLKERLLVLYPDGKFRTLHYDMVFRLINIRPFETGSRIPLEYKIYQFQENLPNFNEKPVNASDLPDEIKEMLIKSGKDTLSNFQLEYIRCILKEAHKAYVISSPTATGKSLIFTVPMIKAALKREKTILIYPRRALASDQLMALLEYIMNVNEFLKKEKRYSITISIDDGDTPRDKDEIKYGTEFRGVNCPICKKKKQDAKLIYAKENETPLIRCQRGHTFDFILPTKDQTWRNPPSILITNGWILNRRLMEPQAQKLFKEPIKYIVLDEAHVYKEETGAHIHFVIDRLKKVLKDNTNTEPLVIISSATLPRETLLDFASKLLNLNVTEIFWENYEKLVSKGREKFVIHLVLLPNPFRSAEVLAENILLFLIEWSYFSGNKSLFFVDSTQEIHRLRHFAEVIIKRRVKGTTRALEHLKSIHSVEEPFYWGHYSPKAVSEKDFTLVDAFSNTLDYHYGGLDKSRRFLIEEAYKKGSKRCLLATSTLELGIDIGDISVIAHYRYPFSGENYIQRIGRAGRSEESLFTTLSILILTNSPTQLKYVYGEETPSLFELPLEYIIPLPLENDSIRETHQFLRVLDTLAKFNKPTLIQTSDIRELWRGKTWREVFLEIEKLLKNGIGVQPDAKPLLTLYLERLQHRKDLLELTDEEVPFPLKFKEKLDLLKELEEWTTTKQEDMESIFGELFPISIRKFFTELSNRVSSMNADLEHIYKHFKAGDRDSFEKVGRRIELQSKALKNTFLTEINNIDRNLNEFWKELMDKGAPEFQRDSLKKLVGELPEIKAKLEEIQISYKELLAFFLNIKFEVESLLSPKMYWRLNLVEALNLLGIPNYHISLLFDKPLPKIYVNYPELPRPMQEYMERTIDKLLWICTPFRVTPIEEYFFTIVFGLHEQRYKVEGYTGYTPFEGGDTFTFKYFNKRYTAWTPHFVNMLNLNKNILEVYSDTIGGSQNSKLVLGNVRTGHPSHDLENCRFCRYGFIISSEQRDICTRTRRECSVYHTCGGTKWFFRPEPPQRTSYLGLVKVHPQIYTNAKNFESDLMAVSIGKVLVVKLGKGSLFDRALVGCHLISSDFFYSPMFNLTHNTLGYRISSNGIALEFQEGELKQLLKKILEAPDIYSWLVVKYLVSDKYFKERGDVNLELCQRAFEGLIDEEGGTRAFRDELRKLLKKKEITEELLDFATFTFLHSLSHLFHEYIVDYLKTDPENIAYHIEKNEYKIYLIENAEKGLGLTETLLNSIRGKEKEFFIDFFKWSLQVISDCERHEGKVKELVSKELHEKIAHANKERQEKFNEIDAFVKRVNQLIRTEYKIDIPVEILRNMLVRKFGNDPLVMEAIISNVPYCWDGCYNCVRLDRGCNYDPFKQMTRISKRLLVEVVKRMLGSMEIPVQVGSGFGWILEEVSKTKNILRISSPWLSRDIIQNYIEPLLKKNVEVRIVTRKDLNNEEQTESLSYLSNLVKTYKNIKVRHLDSLHAKMILIDDRIGIKGSMNLTFSGMYKNVELVERYDARDITEKLTYNFESIFNMAKDL